MSVKKKVTKEILTSQKYFERTDWASRFSRMLENLTVGPLGELNYGEMFQTAF